MFSTSIIQQFLLDSDSSTSYWIVRKTIVCLAYDGGLRLTEIMDVQIEFSRPEHLEILVFQLFWVFLSFCLVMANLRDMK